MEIVAVAIVIGFLGWAVRNGISITIKYEAPTMPEAVIPAAIDEEKIREKQGELPKLDDMLKEINDIMNGRNDR